MQTAKLGRKKEHRERTLRNMLTSLILFESITTTVAKAKALSPIAERLITRTASGSLADRRHAKSILFDDNAVSKIFEDINQRKADRTSGFVRLTKLPVRPGDGAPMMRVELILTPLEKVLEEKTKTVVKVRKTAQKQEEGDKE